jgi:hypothetical protein
MQTLPQFQSDDRNFQLMQNSWGAILSPLLKLPLVNGVTVTDVTVTSGANVINHKLGRKPQGWFTTDINAAITLYRSQPFDPLTLTLTASGAGVISLYVY